ncbi:reverse transcriptase [Gossypium australe]|uniref:Reverse transcriptase n=1 Tax=Gossypium australe TaxID=47621 RepID=A0A5B6W984_9ROSI|nr:reverse transcriptase [Gossypium australe]
MGEALAQVQEVANHIQTLAIQADVLSLKYVSESDRGRELVRLLKQVKTLSLRAKPYINARPVAGATTRIISKGATRNDGSDIGIPKKYGKSIGTIAGWRTRKRERWLEEKFTAMENVDYHCRVNAKDLSLVLDLMLPPKFKTPEFEKYNGTSCPEAHITMFCRRMTGYVNNDQLLIHCFQDSLIRLTTKWLTLQNMEKKQNESFRQYTQRWGEVATQVRLLLLEKETIMLFINTLKAPFINHMLGSATKSFSDIVMSSEMIENAVRSAQCDYHVEISGHSIENCTAFKKVVERLIKMGIVKFDDAPSAENPLSNHTEDGVNAIDGKGIVKTRGTTVSSIIKRDIRSKNAQNSEPSYKDSKRVPCNYDCNVTFPGRENSASTSKEDQDVARPKPLVNEPAKEEEVKEFLKFLKHSEYSVVEQLHKQPGRISILALLLNSEVHRSALMKVLNETYVVNDISVNKLDRLVNNISADNFIFFNDDEIPPGALNVLPLSTLNRLPVDSSHMKVCQNVVRAFDGTERRVMGRIEIPLLIGPTTNEVDFLVMDIKPSYNCLLGRPWIHSAGAVPSSLYQKLKLVSEVRIPMSKISRATRMGSQLMVGNGALPGKGLGRHLQRGVETPTLKDKHDRFGLGTPNKESIEEMMRNVHINAIHEETIEGGTMSDICPYEPGSVLDNWTAEEIPVFFRAYKELSTDIVVHRLPIKEDCKPVQQKLRRMRPDIVMPFGLKNAGATYQRAMVTLFHDMMHKEIEVYVDDMIAKSRIEIEHIQVLRKLFLRLRKFQLKLNPTKYTFGARSGKLLGFVVSEKGIEIDSDKVRAIQELPSPHTQKEVRGFLGRLNYIARFISQLTERCDPIFRLLKKHNPGVWDDECQKAFQKLISKLDSLKYMMESITLNGRMARWQILLSKFDIVYVNQKAVKGSAIADFLANRALEDYEPLNFDFPNEKLMYVAATEEDATKDQLGKLNFDGASNAVGNGIGAVLVSPNGDHYLFTCKLDFDCTNNMAEYEACIMGLRVAIERKIRALEVHGDSALVIYQLKDENKMADALATLASMIKVSKQNDVKPIQISIYEASAHCYNVEEEERDDHPWYHDILRYVRNCEYPDQATENEKRMLRRITCDYVLDREILYKRRKDQILLRCVDVVEAKKILEEVHKGVCGTHANGFTMARQIMRFGTSTGATPFSLVYGMEAVLLIEIEIPSLRVLSELKLDEAEWIQSRYDQLNLIEEKRLKAIRHGQMYQKRMMRAYDKKVRPREFHKGDLIHHGESHLPKVAMEQIEAITLISLKLQRSKLKMANLIPLAHQPYLLEVAAEQTEDNESYFPGVAVEQIKAIDYGTFYLPEVAVE